MGASLRPFIIPGLLGLCLSGCALAGPTEERFGKLEAQLAEQKIQDTRLALLEDRLDALQSQLGDLRAAQKPPPGYTLPARTVAPRQVAPPAPYTPPPLAEAKMHSPGQTQLLAPPLERPTQAAAAVPAVSSPAAPSVASQAGKTPPPAPGVPAVPVSDATPASTPATPAPGPAPKSQVQEKKPLVAETAPKIPPKSENELYRDALKALESGQASRALERFKSFQERYPASNLAPNALYWIGECYYSLKQYDKAIITFKDVVAKYQKHPKAAAAMMKAGFAYDKLGDKENARFYLENLLADFPGSEPAALGKKKLATLK